MIKYDFMNGEGQTVGIANLPRFGSYICILQPLVRFICVQLQLITNSSTFEHFISLYFGSELEIIKFCM
jgi:hypothetical protein